MKRIILTIISILSISCAYGSYTPTETEKQTTQDISNQIDNIINNDHELQYEVIRKLNIAIEKQDIQPHAKYVTTTILNNLKQQFEEAKKQSQKNLKTTYQNIINQQESKIKNKKPLPSECYVYINDLDDVSFAYNISLPVLIATRYREFTCGYSRPANHNGPMQIITRDYGTGPFDNHEQFLQAMEDYAHFTNGKHSRYNRVNKYDTAHTIKQNYTNISYKDIVKYSALYNGLGTVQRNGKTVVNIYGDIYPARPSYVFQNFGDENSSTRDGVMPASIKAMQRRIQNK